MPDSTVGSLLALHQAFWNRELKEPIINVDCTAVAHTAYVPGIPPKWEDQDGLIVEPHMLSPEELQPAPITIGGQPAVRGEVVFNTLYPYQRIPWLSGIMGCDLRVSSDSRTLWPVPCLGDDWYRLENQGFAPRLEWLDKLLEFESHVVERYYPQQCIPTLDAVVRGPGDLLIQVLGPDRAYLGFYDHPDEMKRLLAQMTDVYIHWARAQLEALPQVWGGYCNQWGIWSPGTTVRTQEDLAVNLSPQIFKEFILPCSTRIVEAFEYQCFHTHSGVPQLAEWVLEIDELHAVDICLDPKGMSLEELISLGNRVLERKSLIVAGPFTPRQLDALVAGLSPRGLWLDVELVTEEELATIWNFDRTRKLDA